jgi:virulence factor Mce-like protein
MVIAAIVAVVVSYNADRGLPFAATERISVQLRNAAELNRGDTVQIGGARVGIVRAITAVPDGAHPYARIELSLGGHPRVPTDSTVSVRPLSILGEKTLVITPGHAPATVAPGGVLPLARARPVVDLNDALSTFDAATQSGLRGTVTGLAAGLAGRGNDVNELLAAAAPMLPALRRVSDVLAEPPTDLPGAITAADRLVTALAPVSATIPPLVADAATTFAAAANAAPSLGDALDRLPGTESASTAALEAAEPALGYLRTLAVDLRPAGAALPAAARRLTRALVAGTPALADAVQLRRPLADLGGRLLRSLPPRSDGLADSLDELGVTVRGVQRIGSVVGPAQEVCNVLGTALRNGGDVIGEGDAQGAWFTFLPLLTPFIMPTGASSTNTHVNDAPTEDGRGCVAGNEPFLPGPRFGNPPTSAITTAHDVTAPPSAATARAAAAGLLTAPPGARLR